MEQRPYYAGNAKGELRSEGGQSLKITIYGEEGVGFTFTVSTASNVGLEDMVGI